MKTYSIDIPPLIEEKIREQAIYIAEDKPLAALQWYKDIFNQINTLETFPERCAEASESLYFNYTVRLLLIGNYRILFRIKEDTIRILEFKGGSQSKPA